MGRRLNDSAQGLPSPTESSHHAPESDRRPLEGTVLCCTSIAPEQRDRMWEAAREMGASTKLDLIKDTTHLIIGAVDTPKYKYVARERPDIHVLLPSWLEAVRDAWIAGDEVDIGALAVSHRLPSLWSLQICVTGFNDLQERTELQDAVNANGAVYHRDLTKAVTHLIAAVPTGKKYEYAAQWGIKIVTIEWLQQSLQRGMILEESLYSPTMPPEDRGSGATKSLQRTDSERGAPNKRKLAEGPSGPTGPDGKRKLRRTASTKLESQNSGIWEDMSTAETSQAQPGAEWIEFPAMEAQPQPPARAPLSKNGSDGDAHPVPIKNMMNSAATYDEGMKGFFDKCSFCIVGLERRQTAILQHHVRSNGAEVLDSRQLATESAKGRQNMYCVVPWDVPYHTIRASLTDENIQELQCNFVTVLWVEKCIESKALVDPSTLPIYRLMKRTAIPKMSDLTITPTGFMNMDLLHFSKAVKWVGAKYYETLDSSTSVLVTGPNASPSSEKFTFAFDNGIPIVKSTWFWTFLEKGQMEKMEDHSVVQRPLDRAARNARVGERRYSSPAKTSDTARQAQRPPPPNDSGLFDQPEQTRPSSSVSARPNETDSRAQNKEDKSQPLREKTESESNSQRRAETALLDTANKPLGPGARRTGSENHPFLYQDDDDHPSLPAGPISAPPAGHATTQQSHREQKNAIAHAIDHLRAHAQSASGAASDSSPHDRRRRKLGRAVSNPSSLGSRTNSMQMLVGPEGDDDDEEYNGVRKKRTEIMPSQALMYEHEESKIAREKLLRRTITDGSVDEDGMRRVESIGRVTDAIDPKFERKASTRRGAMR